MAFKTGPYCGASSAGRCITSSRLVDLLGDRARNCHYIAYLVVCDGAKNQINGILVEHDKYAIWRGGNTLDLIKPFPDGRVL